MKLLIITTSSQQEFDTLWIELNTVTGSMIIQPAHAPMIIELKPHSIIRYALPSGKELETPITQGIAHVTREDVTIFMPVAS